MKKNKKIEEKVIGKLDEEVIDYFENDGTHVLLNFTNDELYRENTEMVLKYRFNLAEKTIGKIWLKDLNREMVLNLHTESLQKSDRSYHVEYLVEEDRFIYDLEYVEVKR